MTRPELLLGLRQDWARDRSRGCGQHASPSAWSAATRPGPRPAGPPPRAEQAAALRQGDPFVYPPLSPEALALFLEGGAEPGSGRDTPEAAHGE